MNSINHRIEVLVRKFLKGRISIEEEKELNDWYGQNQDEGIDIPAEFEVSEGRLQKRILHSILSNINKQRSTAKLWPRIAIAAAVALVVLGVYFFNYNNRTIPGNRHLIAQDIAPGKQGATLTLANGKKIRLSGAANGEIAKEAGIVITKSANGQIVYEAHNQVQDDSETSSARGGAGKINTLSTARGETYQLHLPDGSLVYLNAASSLTYTANLMEGGKRKVKLEGEGYFEIFKDKKHPFIVESKGQEVEVLGTHFNISTYADEPVVKTTLLEGSVKISLPKSGTSRVLTPGFQAIKTANSIQITEVNTDLATAWKNNNFTFDLLPIKEIMPMIARWYDVEVIYNGPAPTARFWGSVSRFENISKVLEALAATENVHFKIEGRRVYVSKLAYK